MDLIAEWRNKQGINFDVGKNHCKPYSKFIFTDMVMPFGMNDQLETFLAEQADKAQLKLFKSVIISSNFYFLKKSSLK